MSIAPLDLLRSAEELLTSGSEIGYRESASKAYYAIFHAADCLDLPEARTGAKGGVHHHLAQCPIDCSGPQLKSIGYMVRTCHMERIRASYQLDNDFTLEDAKAQVALARKAWGKIDAVLARPQIFTG